MFKLAFVTAASILALSGSVMAADLAMPMAAAPMAAAAPTSTWDGPYIGVFAGYGWGQADVDLSQFSLPNSSYNYSGFLLGVQGGYNFHLSDQIVAGVSADIAYDGASGSGNVDAGGDTGSSQLRWTASVTGRLGVDMGSWTPYALAGIAFANNDGGAVVGGTGFSQNVTHTGYTVGAGVEFALADNISADVEYRYSNYGSQNYNGGTPFNVPTTLSDSSVRVGLNYHF